MLSRFHLIPERNGQTDGHTDGRTDGGQTDRFAISISRVSMLTRDKKNVSLNSSISCLPVEYASRVKYKTITCRFTIAGSHFHNQDNLRLPCWNSRNLKPN